MTYIINATANNASLRPHGFCMFVYLEPKAGATCDPIMLIENDEETYFTTTEKQRLKKCTAYFTCPMHLQEGSVKVSSDFYRSTERKEGKK